MACLIYVIRQSHGGGSGDLLSTSNKLCSMDYDQGVFIHQGGHGCRLQGGPKRGFPFYTVLNKKSGTGKMEVLSLWFVLFDSGKIGV